jgi:hypothetical protein
LKGKGGAKRRRLANASFADDFLFNMLRSSI